MPIYEYRCPNCDERFEQRRPMSQAGEAARCPHCQTQSPQVISRLARVSHAEGGGEDDGGAEAVSQGASDFYTGGHSHGPMGHSH